MRTEFFKLFLWKFKLTDTSVSNITCITLIPGCLLGKCFLRVKPRTDFNVHMSEAGGSLKPTCVIKGHSGCRTTPAFWKREFSARNCWPCIGNSKGRKGTQSYQLLCCNQHPYSRLKGKRNKSLKYRSLEEGYVELKLGPL